jgi:hypothetical protein
MSCVCGSLVSGKEKKVGCNYAGLCISPALEATMTTRPAGFSILDIGRQAFLRCLV